MRGGTNVYNLPENYFVKFFEFLIHLQARSMCAVLADKENHKFLVGTNSFKKTNEVHLLKYSEDSNRID